MAKHTDTILPIVFFIIAIALIPSVSATAYTYTGGSITDWTLIGAWTGSNGYLQFQNTTGYKAHVYANHTVDTNISYFKTDIYIDFSIGYNPPTAIIKAFATSNAYTGFNIAINTNNTANSISCYGFTCDMKYLSYKKWYTVELTIDGSNIVYNLINTTSGTVLYTTTTSYTRIPSNIISFVYNKDGTGAGDNSNFIDIRFDNIIASDSSTAINNFYFNVLSGGYVCVYVGVDNNQTCRSSNFSVSSKIDDTVSFTAWATDLAHSFSYFYITVGSASQISYLPSYTYYTIDLQTVNTYIYFDTVSSGLNNFFIEPANSGAVDLWLSSELMGRFTKNFSFYVPVGKQFTVTAVSNSGYTFQNYSVNGSAIWYDQSFTATETNNNTINTTVHFNYTGIVTPTPTATPSPYSGINGTDNLSGASDTANNSLGSMTNISSNISSRISSYNYTMSKNIFSYFIPPIFNMIPAKVWGVIILGWALEGALLLLRR